MSIQAERISKALEAAQGNLNHENMHLDDYEKSLIQMRLEKKISHDEFINEVIKYISIS
ncbi:MAG: hypothetical protein RSA57_03965 [Cetobacterium sp.]|uniref:hypothetical protein n=1 Tax=Bacteria TaxID=2 RepID=UPI002FC6E141